MARIHIEDLPPDTDLTPEELEQIYGGAGRRPSFRPGFEALEVRQMMDAALGHALPDTHAAAGGAEANPLAHVRVLAENPFQASQLQRGGSQDQLGGVENTAAAVHQPAGPGVSNAALDALWAKEGMGVTDAAPTAEQLRSMQPRGGGEAEMLPVSLPAQQQFYAQKQVLPEQLPGPKLTQEFKLPRGVQEVPNVKWGQVEEFDGGLRRTGTQTGGHVYVETLKKDGSLERLNKTTNELQVFNHTGARVYYGRQEGDNYVVETFDQYQPGVIKSKEIYDKAPALGGTMQTSDRTYADRTVHGEWKEVQGVRRWVETSSSPNQFTRTEVYEGPGRSLLSRDTTYSKDGTHVVEVYAQDWKLQSRETTYKNGVVIKGELKGDNWVETTTYPKGFKDPLTSQEIRSRTEVFDKAGEGRKLLSRESTYANGVTIKGSPDGNQWVEKTTNSTEFHSRTEYYNQAGPGRTLLKRVTINKVTGWKVTGVPGEKGRWVETTTNANEFKSRTEVYDKEGPGRKLLSRETTREDGVKVTGAWEKKGAWEGDKWVVGERWVETRSATARTNYTIYVYDKVDGTLLTRDTAYKSGTFDHIVIKNGVNIGTSYTGKVEILKDGRLKLYVLPTVTGAQADGDYKIYQRVGNEWKLVFYKHQVQSPAGGSRLAWMEESWSADGGRYVQDIWAVEDHSIAKEDDGWHYSRTVVEGGKATTTFYHARQFSRTDIPYMWGSYQHYINDAQVTYEHAVDANGKLGEMLRFNIIPQGHGDWENTWTKDGGWDTNSGGWPYGGGGKGRPVEMGVTYHGGAGDGTYVLGYPVDLNPGGGAEVVDVGTLPFLKVESHQAQDGTFVETISDLGHTQAVQFVYSGPDRTTLIQQTFGHMENGQWVQSTTRSKDLVTRIADRFRTGGNTVQYEERNIVKTADGFAVTYHVTTPEIHWNIDTNPNFIQNWEGTVTLEFKKVGTIDGVDQYSLVKVTSNVTWWHQRSNSDWNGTDNQPLSKLGVTEADLQALVASWNTRAVL